LSATDYRFKIAGDLYMRKFFYLYKFTT